MFKFVKNVPKDIIIKERLLTELNIICPTENWIDYENLTCRDLENIKNYLLAGNSIENVRSIIIQ